jgi:hypothetical protein
MNLISVDAAVKHGNDKQVFKAIIEICLASGYHCLLVFRFSLMCRREFTHH